MDKVDWTQTLHKLMQLNQGREGSKSVSYQRDQKLTTGVNHTLFPNLENLINKAKVFLLDWNTILLLVLQYLSLILKVWMINQWLSKLKTSKMRKEKELMTEIIIQLRLPVIILWLESVILCSILVQFWNPNHHKSYQALCRCCVSICRWPIFLCTNRIGVRRKCTCRCF